MKTLTEIKEALATTNKNFFTSKDVAEIIGISYSSLMKTIEKHEGLKPSDRNSIYLLWTSDEIIRFVEFKVKHHYKRTDSGTTANSEIATSETSPIDAVIAFNDAVERDKNFKAYMKIRRQFDSMTEKDLQRFFAPMTERFKFKYIIANVKSVQSQTLTCIAKGRLRGLEKYKLNFAAFLELLKFCVDNNCPTDFDNDNGEVNA